MLRRIERGDIVTKGVETGRVLARRQRGYPAPMLRVSVHQRGTATTYETWLSADECAVISRRGLVRRWIHGSCDEGAL